MRARTAKDTRTSTSRPEAAVVANDSSLVQPIAALTEEALDIDKDTSDVFVRGDRIDEDDEDDAARDAALGVTLFVFGWENVEPGPLSWVFPSLRTALDAVRTMKNAIRWCIVSGRDWPSIDVAREYGAVLVEELG